MAGFFIGARQAHKTANRLSLKLIDYFACFLTCGTDPVTPDVFPAVAPDTAGVLS